MSSNSPFRPFRMVLTTVLALAACVIPSAAQSNEHAKILGGYFEEWSIYYAGYNIANLQQNGVAGKLTHLHVRFRECNHHASPACAIADTWADYQTPYLPSVSGVAYTGSALRKLSPRFNSSSNCIRSLKF